MWRAYFSGPLTGPHFREPRFVRLRHDKAFPIILAPSQKQQTSQRHEPPAATDTPICSLQVPLQEALQDLQNQLDRCACALRIHPHRGSQLERRLG
jgi:hypothetical protein